MFGSGFERSWKRTLKTEQSNQVWRASNRGKQKWFVELFEKGNTNNFEELWACIIQTLENQSETFLCRAESRTTEEAGDTAVRWSSMKVFFAYFLVHKKVRSSAKERKGNALASGADEGRDKLRKASGSCKWALIRRYPNGETRYGNTVSTCCESNSST